jgi:osmoprotectant transport system substrate-binding protein
VAVENGLVTMSDFGAWVAGGGEVKLAASTEFVSSPAVLPAMQEIYGFALTPDQTVVLSGGDTAATIQAAARGTSGVNAAMVYGTDGGVAATGLVVMADDKGVQPVYAPTAIVRAEVLEEYPAIADVLAPIFAGLDLVTLQELNGRIQVGGEPAEAVARDYLSSLAAN